MDAPAVDDPRRPRAKPARRAAPDLDPTRFRALAARARHIGNGDPSDPETSGSDRETFVTLGLRSEMPRWKHVPFVLRAAKGVERVTPPHRLRFRRAPASVARFRSARGARREARHGDRDRTRPPPSNSTSRPTPESASTRLCVLRCAATTRSPWIPRSRKKLGESLNPCSRGGRRSTRRCRPTRLAHQPATSLEAARGRAMPKRRRTPLWVAARATNRALLLTAYGNAYLSEYRQLVARFDQRPKTVLNDIWAERGRRARRDRDAATGTAASRSGEARTTHASTSGRPTSIRRTRSSGPRQTARRRPPCRARGRRARSRSLSLVRDSRPRGRACTPKRRPLGPEAARRATRGGCDVRHRKPADLGPASSSLRHPSIARSSSNGRLPGSVYRFLILDGELLDVVRRDPSSVEGDGVSTVRDLIRAENHARVEAAGARGNQLVQPDHDCLLALRVATDDPRVRSLPPAIAHRVKRSNGDGGRLDTHSIPRSTVLRRLIDDATRAVASGRLAARRSRRGHARSWQRPRRRPGRDPRRQLAAGTPLPLPDRKRRESGAVRILRRLLADRAA